jgi:Domain of unknown function (DUF4399)
MKHALMTAALMIAFVLSSMTPPHAEEARAPAPAENVMVAPLAEKKVIASTAPRAFFVDLADGAEVTSPFKVKFGIENMEIVPAGTEKTNSGHFHLLIDVDAPTDEQDTIPKDEKNLHFGKGETETEVTLPAGKHTLQIVMGDANHMLHLPAAVMSDKITVTVK